jgi:putative ABC transport system permease protein
MNLFYLSYRSLIHKPLSSLLSVLLFGFGISIIVLILLVSTHLKSEINKNASGIDLVIGAKGSPLQLILANIFHADYPTGNISLKEASKLSRNRLIKSAIPLSLGDSYAGYRIVGTTPDYLNLYKGQFKEGSWEQGEKQAVIGAKVAEALSLKLNDEFSSTHGLAETGAGHDEHPYSVSGILSPSGTVLDDLILVSVASVWAVHGHEEHTSDSIVEKVNIPHLGLEVTKEQFENEEITSLLIKYASPMGAIRLPQMVNKNSNFQAASPAFETARLFSLIGTGVDVMNILGMVIIIISAASVFISLVNSLKERKYELAIMRSMGASRKQVFFHVILEGLFLTIFGVIFGFGLAHIGFLSVGSLMETMKVDGLFFVSEEWNILIGSFAVGIISAIVPAIMAYRTDISRTLAKG